MLGVAADPAFTSNHYVYLYYTYKKSGSCPYNTSASPVNRVSRFTVGAGNIADPASELVLIDNIPSPNGNHNAGDLAFNGTGNLYVSVGDGGCDYRGDSGCAGANDAARDRHTLLGKILRITRTGGIPADNPFVQTTGAVRCNTGNGQPGQVCQETFAWGLRNPFRMAFDPNATGTRFFINDVGQNAWEEIDFQPAGAGGAFYGWRCLEGTHPTNYAGCVNPLPQSAPPILEYPRSGQPISRTSVTGGYVYRGPSGALPQGTYVYGDYCTGEIFGWSGGTSSLLLDTTANLSSFGEDEQGELYLLTTTPTGKNGVLKLVKK